MCASNANQHFQIRSGINGRKSTLWIGDATAKFQFIYFKLSQHGKCAEKMIKVFFCSAEKGPKIANQTGLQDYPLKTPYNDVEKAFLR